MKATYVDHMGSDLEVVNDARVSFGKRSDLEVVTKKVRREGYEVGDLPYIEEVAEFVLKEKDKKLIQFLARGCTTGDWKAILAEIEDKGFTSSFHGDKFARQEMADIINHVRKMPKHWTPFANGGTIKLHLKVPLFVLRQLQKHQAGFEPFNEISRRYVKSEPEFYVPDVWRKAADNVKQGSSDEPVHEGLYMAQQYAHIAQETLETYNRMLDQGVCPEQARMVLLQSMYTEVRWKGNLYAWATMYNTRTDPHTQKETRDVVKQIGDIIQPLFPVSWEALTNE